jgi:hypothetical protein
MKLSKVVFQNEVLCQHKIKKESGYSILEQKNFLTLMQQNEKNGRLQKINV